MDSEGDFRCTPLLSTTQFSTSQYVLPRRKTQSLAFTLNELCLFQAHKILYKRKILKTNSWHSDLCLTKYEMYLYHVAPDEASYGTEGSQLLLDVVNDWLFQKQDQKQRMFKHLLTVTITGTQKSFLSGRSVRSINYN